MNNNDVNTYHAHLNGNGVNGGVGNGGGGGGEDFLEKHASSSDDDDYEPCTKRILPCLFAW